MTVIDVINQHELTKSLKIHAQGTAKALLDRIPVSVRRSRRL